MMFYFIFLIVYEMFNCLPCIDGKNFCNRCNPVTKLCAQCKYDVFIPDEDGGCKGSQKCVNGDNFCSECEDDKKKCKICEEGYLPDENGGCTYSNNCEVSIEGVCVKCIDDFIMVGDSGYNLFEGLRICKSNHSEVFKNCQIKDTNKGTCKMCKDKFYLTSEDKKCVETQNCAESKYGVCKKCNGGYYLDKSQDKCVRQSGSLMHCKISLDNEKCDTCLDDYYFDENGECISSNFCAKGKDYMCQKCKDGYFLSQNFECTPEENCIVAKKYLGICTLCQENYYIDYKDGKCKSNLEDNGFRFCRIADGDCTKCIDGFYLGDDKQCSTTENCAESEGGRCVECRDRFYLGEDFKCSSVKHCIYTNVYSECIECEGNYYIDPSARTCKVGEGALLNCKSAREGSPCDKCKDDYYLNQTDKLCYPNSEENDFYKCAKTDEKAEYCISCTKGYYLGDEDFKCSKIEGCLISEDEDKCLKCDSDFYCLDASTGNCENNYRIETEEQKIYYMCNVTNEEGTACEVCLDGYTLNDDGLCIDDAHCEETEEGVCQRCLNDIFDSYCLNEYFGCIPSTYGNCLECNDILHLSRCTKCHDGFELNNFNICVNITSE